MLLRPHQYLDDIALLIFDMPLLFLFLLLLQAHPKPHNGLETPSTRRYPRFCSGISFHLAMAGVECLCLTLLFCRVVNRDSDSKSTQADRSGNDNDSEAREGETQRESENDQDGRGVRPAESGRRRRPRK